MAFPFSIQAGERERLGFAEPVFDGQAGDAAKVTDIAGDDGMAVGEGNCGDTEVGFVERRAAAFEVGAHSGVDAGSRGVEG